MPMLGSIKQYGDNSSDYEVNCEGDSRQSGIVKTIFGCTNNQWSAEIDCLLPQSGIISETTQQTGNKEILQKVITTGYNYISSVHLALLFDAMSIRTQHKD